MGEPASAGIRLQKILSYAGIASRRAAEELITQGRVEVNGHVVTALGTRADPATDEVRVDGRRVKADPVRRYLLMHKPRGVVSTRSDPQKRTTVLDVLARAGLTGYFYPVGRLDYDSEGLIVLTNDGAFAERLSHPRYGVPRTYEALVEGVPDAHDVERLRRGVSIEGERTEPARVRRVRTIESKRGPQTWLELTVHEGRNRQVRKMCDAIGHPVDRLRRVRIGVIADDELKPGQVRDLRANEIRSLTRSTDAAASAPPARRSPAHRSPARRPKPSAPRHGRDPRR